MDTREIAEANAVDFVGLTDRTLIADRLEAVIKQVSLSPCDAEAVREACAKAAYENRGQRGADIADIIAHLDLSPFQRGEGVLQKWIPVSERLPDAYLEVLIYAVGCAEATGYHDVADNTWRMVYGDRELSGVTHWMPLPDAPLAAAQGEK